MQTINTTTNPEKIIEERMPAPRENTPNYFARTWGLWAGLAIFAVYLYFVKQMQGIDFDTTFLALYCASLTVFVINTFVLTLRSAE